jgi:hypothetical protein
MAIGVNRRDLLFVRDNISARVKAALTRLEAISHD